MTGMHRVFTPTIIQTIAKPAKKGWSCRQRSALTCRWAVHHWRWRGKRKTRNCATALAAAASAIMAGISEPALYGVAIRLKRPLIASLISGFICGAVAGMAACQPLNGSAGAVTSVQFFDPAIPMSIVVLAVMALAVVLSFILTLLLGFEDIPVEEAAADARTSERTTDRHQR